jgi:hypothetical protein
MAGHKMGDGDSWVAFLNIAQLVSMGGGGGLIGCFNKWGATRARAILRKKAGELVYTYLGM